MSDKPRSPIESGCPDGFQYIHPVMRKNYGAGNFTSIHNRVFFVT